MASPPISNSRPRLLLFETKVARRMLGLFLLCALLPTILLAVIGYRHVSSQLYQQSRVQLRDDSKAAGMAIIERLTMIDEELRAVANGSASPIESQESRLKGIVLLQAGGQSVRVRDSIPVSIPRLTGRQEEHLAAGKAVIVTVPGSRTHILVGRRSGLAGGNPGTIWADIDLRPLWGPAPEETALISLCVIGGDGAFLTCPSEDTAGISRRDDLGDDAGNSEWVADGEEHLAGHWTAFLGFEWAAPSWTILLSQRRAGVLAPMQDFKRTFVVVMAIALALVLLLSNIQIRRRMEPLTLLQQGTQRVATGNFDEPVTISSGDEFEHLAASFNSMAHRLGRQFRSLSVINDIGRAALSEVHTDRVVDTVIARIAEILPRTEVALLLRGSTPDTWRARTNTIKGQRDIRVLLEDRLRAEPESYLVLSGPGSLVLRDCFRKLSSDSSVLLLPLMDHHSITGIIALAFYPGLGVTSEDIAQARQMADQVAIAIANTRLVERLDQLSWGTLSALARTIDANSPWTAGHSERVTMVSLAIGRELELPARDLDAIHRGGLLHDIGKIGIPSAILDKPGRLTDEEMDVIKSHPAVGARILAPISAFQDIIPIVRNHHEKFDGTGYPDGLAGLKIPYLARVVAVADVYDALVSDRPYRPGWTPDAAAELIQKTASSHHDPEVVAAFLSALSNGRIELASLPSIGETSALESIHAAGVAS